VLFGILFSIIVFSFPLMNIFLFLKKVKFQHSNIAREIEKEFDEMYNVLYREHVPGKSYYLQYFNVFIFRRIVFIMTAYYLSGPEYTII
jgi:hypothetical protein